MAQRQTAEVDDWQAVNDWEPVGFIKAPILEPPEWMQRAVGAAGQRIVDLPGNLMQMGREALAPARNREEYFASQAGGQGALATRRLVLAPMLKLYGQAGEELARGETGRAISAGTAGTVPVLGPMFHEASERIAVGEGPEVLGETAVDLATAKYLPKGVRATGRGLAKLPEIGRGAAEGLAESGFGLRWPEKMHGKTPGYGVLAETEGGRRRVAGSTETAGSVRGRLAAIDAASESEFVAAKAAGKTASSRGAIRVLDEEIAAAERGQHPELAEILKKQRERLTIDTATKEPLPTELDPLRFWEIKRHWGDSTEWNKVNPHIKGRIERAVYRAMDSELDRIAPRTAGLNQRSSSLISVRNRADITAEGPSLTAGFFNRAAARTGALAGAFGGYMYGGPAGGLVGFVLPELLAHPSTRIGAARLLYRASGGKKLPAPELADFPDLGPERFRGETLRGPIMPGPAESLESAYRYPRQKLLPPGKPTGIAGETTEGGRLGRLPRRISPAKPPVSTRESFRIPSKGTPPSPPYREQRLSGLAPRRAVSELAPGPGVEGFREYLGTLTNDGVQQAVQWTQPGSMARQLAEMELLGRGLPRK